MVYAVIPQVRSGAYGAKKQDCIPKRENKQSRYYATEQRPIYWGHPKIYGNAKADCTASSGTHRRDNSL